MLENPELQSTGAIASVQHSGGNGSNQAGPTTNGVDCVQSWVGVGNKWDVRALWCFFHLFLLAPRETCVSI